jgi:hypothetical protein
MRASVCVCTCCQEASDATGHVYTQAACVYITIWAYYNVHEHIRVDVDISRCVYGLKSMYAHVCYSTLHLYV